MRVPVSHHEKALRRQGGLENVYVFDASRTGKLSFHFILPWKFGDLEQRQDFGKRLKSEWAVADAGTVESYSGCPDTLVYGLNRNIRAPLNSKYGKHNPLMPLNTCGDLVFGATGDKVEVMHKGCLLTGLEYIHNLPKARFEMDSPDPPAKKLKAMHEKPDVCEPVNHAKLLSLVIPMLRETDTTSTFSHWVDDKTMYFKTNGSRTCSLGHVHKSNSFHVQIENAKV